MSTITNSRWFHLEFKCDNACFEPPDTADAIADALLQASKKVRFERLIPNEAVCIRDNNGNRIGTFKFESR